ncbi:hypothetical protein Hanom_Chr11g00980031 [Helianthus anomalus]
MFSRNMHIYLFRFTFCSKFCVLTWHNVHVRFNIFMLSIFFLFDRFVATHGS